MIINNNQSGFLLVLDGIDGTGKTTLSHRLASFLIKNQFKVILSREPTTGQFGKKIRESAINGRLSLEEELNLFVQDRKEHIETVIRPALDNGEIVILDRYYFSTMAYQGARGGDVENIKKIHEDFAINPDLIILLQLDINKALERISNSREGADLFEGKEYLQKVSDIYDKIEHENIRRINADQSTENIIEIIFEEIKKQTLNKVKLIMANQNEKHWTDDEKKELYRLAETLNRSWTKIAPHFNTTPSVCRNKYRKTNWGSFLLVDVQEKNKFKNAKEKIDEIEVLFSDKDDDKKALIDIEKNKILQNNTSRLKKELVERMAVTDLILEKIESSVIKVPKIDVAKITYPKIASKHTPEEACLVLSDLHVGLACIPEEVGNIGHYNKDIFLKRLNNLINSVKKITEIHRNSYKIDTLNIFALGDFVHGSNDAGQWGMLHTEQNIMDQIFMVISEISKALLTLNKIFKNINFYGVVGNHGRVDKRGVEKIFVNWDYVCYKFIESALSNNKNIKFTIPKTPFCVAEVFNNKFLLVHGDTVKSWGGLPVYGMVRAESRYQNLIQKTKNPTDLLRKIKESGKDNKNTEEWARIAYNYSKPLDYIIMGHHHQSAEIEANGGSRVIMNSSFVSGDDYTINQLLTSGEASQKFFGVHPEGRSWQYEINLNRE